MLVFNLRYTSKVTKTFVLLYQTYLTTSLFIPRYAGSKKKHCFPTPVTDYETAASIIQVNFYKFADVHSLGVRPDSLRRIQLNIGKTMLKEPENNAKDSQNYKDNWNWHFAKAF